MSDNSILAASYLYKVFVKRLILGSICWAMVVVAVLALVRYATPSDFWAGILLLVAAAGFYLWNFVYAVSSIVVSITSSVSKWLKTGIILFFLVDLCCLFLGLLLLIHKLFIN